MILDLILGLVCLAAGFVVGHRVGYRRANFDVIDEMDRLGFLKPEEQA